MLRWLLAAPYTINSNQVGIPKTTNNLGQALAAGTQILLMLIGMASIVFIIAGSFQLVYSRGNPSNVTKARETILYAIVGLGVAMAGYAIVTFVVASFSR